MGLGTKRKVSVAPFRGATFRYGFSTNCDAADAAILGHQDAGMAPIPPKLVFGANSPKPAVAYKKKASGKTESSFIDFNQIVAAKAASWKVTGFKYKNPRSGTRSKAVYVKFNGIKYAWQMSATVYSRITAAQRTQLGIVEATATDIADLVWGVNDPKPPRASRDLGGSKVETFIDPDKIGSLPANSGWTIRVSRATKADATAGVP
jgi:hypothetical protein